MEFNFNLYPDEVVFVRHNPWWNAANRQLFFQHLRSSDAKSEIERIAKDKMEQLFPRMWRNELVNDDAWRFFRNKLDEHTSMKLSILDSNTTLGLTRINSAVESKLVELMDSKDFGQLKSSITNTANIKYAALETELNHRFTVSERHRDATMNEAKSLIADQKRQIDHLNNKIDRVSGNQVATFFGGAVVGVSGVFVAMLLRANP